MAGLYVSGVKKPYGCTFCPWCQTLYCFCKAANKDISVLEMNKGPDWCPLVEVPDHGDLIDREELIKIMLNTPIKAVDGVDFDQAWFTRVADTACQFVDDVERQVAVISADKEEV